jgi:hypothetical protein
MTGVKTMARMSPESAAKPVSELERRYRELVAEHARSGLTQREFAAKKGVAATTLSWWKHEIGHRDRLRAGRNGNGVHLVPVQVVTAALDRSRSKGSDPTRTEFVVRLRSGREIRVEHGFDAAELGRLVEVLESC